MKKKNYRRAFVALLCVLALLQSPVTLCFSALAAEGQNRITASPKASLKQGDSGYCYVYADSLEDLASLSVAVYFDPAKVKVTSTYNSVSALLYDSATGYDCLRYTYVFDGNGSAEKTRLFYFYYSVLADAEAGETYFDIVVEEAYDASLNVVSLSGSRSKWSITPRAVNKTCSISGTSSVNTSVGKEFELSYSLSTAEIASGALEVQYNPELFEVIGYTPGSFLNSYLVDTNDLPGSFCLSFAGLEKPSNRQLFTVRFRTLKNVEETSTVRLVAKDLYDFDLQSVTCGGYTSSVAVTHDPSHVEDEPGMKLEAAFHEDTRRLDVTVRLEAESHLGAGDFVLVFPADCLTYRSAEKGFSPTFFTINDKAVSDGLLKFSIISLSDIVTEETVLTVSFYVPPSCKELSIPLSISGSGLADSLTEKIVLSFEGTTATIPAADHSYNAVVTAPTCTEEGYTTYTCTSCGETYVSDYVDAKGHSFGEWYTVKDANCTENGTERRECNNCEHYETNTLPATGHSYNAVVTQPTCTEKGYTTYTCHCGDSYVDNYMDAKGHSYGEWYTVTEATCTENGTERRNCNNCDHYETNTLPATGHSYNAVVTEPTCTEQGYTTYTCQCGDSYVADYTDPTGHSFGEWTTTKDATCTENGEQRRDCDNCDHYETQVIPATGHSYESVVTEPTCTEKGYTTYTCHCGDSYVSDYVDPVGHVWSDWQDTAPGTEERSCTACGETESRDKIPNYDADGNGTVDQADAQLLLSILVGNAEAEVLHDFDFDGKLTIYDCVLLMQQLS